MSRDVEQALREGGHRVTRPRTAVWEALVDAQGHLTAEELAARVEAAEPGVNLASVYRALTLFEQMDLVRQSNLGGEAAGRWELTHPDDHFHLVCSRCGDVDHHIGSLVQRVREHLEEGHSYTVEQVELTVRGICQACATRPPTSRSGPSGA